MTRDTRPPGEHIIFPEVEWLPASSEPMPSMLPARPRYVPPVIGMIEPDHGRLTPWVFWALIVLSFACVVARAEGWL